MKQYVTLHGYTVPGTWRALREGSCYCGSLSPCPALPQSPEAPDRMNHSSLLNNTPFWASTAVVCITLVPESFSTLSLLGLTHAHQVQVSILLSSCWDSLSELVAPLWGDVPEPLASTSSWAQHAHYACLFIPLSPPGQSCGFHPKPLAQGLTHSRSTRWGMLQWLFAMSHIFKNMTLVVT